MADELERRDARPVDGEPPHVHVRTIVIRPTTALGRFALAAGLVTAGVLLVSVGLALVAGLAVAAAVAGVGVVAYRALARGRVAPAGAPPASATRLDPSREVFLPKPKD